MTFTKREFADSLYGAVIGTGQGQVRGADMNEVRAARVAACDRAERAIERAIGTERIILREPDDAMLRQWLDVLQQRRAALQPT